MAELSWTEKRARRRLSVGVGLLIAAGGSLALWGLIAEAVRLI